MATLIKIQITLVVAALLTLLSAILFHIAGADKVDTITALVAAGLGMSAAALGVISKQSSQT
jgi:hypothetical protein